MIGEMVGQYRLVSELGRGRFGITYRGEHLVNGTFAVIKQLSPELTQDEQFSRRFIYESENLVRLYHAHLATILALISQSGNYFIISEDISGHNLADYLNRKEKLIPIHAGEIIAELCTALDYLHHRHLYHQHLHPGNVLINKDGKVKLTDFGLAVLVGEIGITKAVHHPDTVYAQYLTPEQKLGKPANEQTDIYPLGVLLYELITGAGFEPRKFHPLLPATMQKIIAKCTAEDPNERYASVADLSADLNQFINTRTTDQVSSTEKIPAILEPVPIAKRIQSRYLSGFLWAFGLVILFALPLYFLFRVRGISVPATSVFREVPFQREIKPYSKPLEETIAEETTKIKEKPKKAELIKEESMAEVGSENIQPLQPAPPKPFAGEIREETKYIARTKEPQQQEPKSTEKGESLNIPKEEQSMMPYTIDPVPSVMVVVPAGEFTMGSNSGNLDEMPEHRVYVDTFLIDAYEVSNTQYTAFIEATGYPAPSGWKERMYPAGQANYPVTNVSWSEASAYAGWVGCRLPTEVEWEKAARSTDARIYPWGNQFIDNVCNYSGSNFKASVPVGIYPKGRSPYGCYDIAGNVAEWTADVYQLYAGNTASQILSYLDPDQRVLRGGAYDSPKDYLRTSKRSSANYTTKSPAIGFRTVKSLGGIPAIAKANHGGP